MSVCVHELNGYCTSLACVKYKCDDDDDCAYKHTTEMHKVISESLLSIKCSQEAREKCPFDHPCDSEEKAYFEEGSPCHSFNMKLMPPPPHTNADHIRSMTD